MTDVQPTRTADVTEEALRDEARRARRVRFIVDFASHVIMQDQPHRREAEEIVEAAKQQILLLFPGREDTYDLIYAPRFRRLIDEFSATESHTQRSVVIPFRRRT